MTRTEIRERQIRDAHEHFTNHVAKQSAFSENGDRLIVDWRSKSGSSAYYIRYIFDIKYCTLYITGDLGSAIIRLTEEASPKNLAGYINEIDYFVSKIECSTDRYDYNKRLAQKEVKSRFDEYSELIAEHGINIGKIINEIMQNFTSHGIEISTDEYNNLMEMTEQISSRNSEILSDLSSCGRYVCDRIIYWLVGLEMLYEQLSAKQTPEKK